MQLILALALSLPAAIARVPQISRTLDAIESVESGGRCDVIGDGGRALGPLQIHETYWQDAADFDPGLKKLGYRAVVDPIVARRTALAYLTRYSAKTPEQMARRHNGGPRGDLKRATEGYWKKVGSVLTRPSS